MLNIELNEHAAEDAKEIQELRRLGVPEEVIQTAYDNTQAKRQETQTGGDLISRSALLSMLRYNAAVRTDENGETRQLIAIDVNKLIEYVEKMPTAYNVDKVVKQLEEKRGESWEDNSDYGIGKWCAFDTAIIIVGARGGETTC